MVRIAIIGAGGVGALLGAMLARAGHEVGLLARGAALAQIADHGVVLREPAGESVVPLARVTDDPAALGVADLVVMAVKTWQLAALGPQLRPSITAGTIVVPTQNGIEASEILAAALGADHVIGGVAHMISRTEAPGVVRWIGMQPTLRIGALRPGQDVARVADVLRSGGIDAIVDADIQVTRWEKFLFISAYAAVGAVERVGCGELRQRPSARQQLEAAMREVAAIGVARGAALRDDAVAAAMARIDSLPETATASMARDIIAGRPSELHELIGAAVRLGRAAGVATPVSTALYEQLIPLEAAARAKAGA